MPFGMCLAILAIQHLRPSRLVRTGDADDHQLALGPRHGALIPSLYNDSATHTTATNRNCDKQYQRTVSDREA